MEEPQFPTKDLSNKTVVGIALIMFGIILIIYFTERRKSPDYDAIQYLNHTADSLSGASREKDKLIVALQKNAAHLIDTVTIIEKTQVKRYDNYIQTTASLRPDSTIDTSFAAARLRFRQRWESGVFFER